MSFLLASSSDHLSFLNLELSDPEVRYQTDVTGDLNLSGITGSYEGLCICLFLLSIFCLQIAFKFQPELMKRAVNPADPKKTTQKIRA